MVGSLLIQRILEEQDCNCTPVFLSTSINWKNAYEMTCLLQLDIILTCHGSNYTAEIYNFLRLSGWNGYWVDAASLLRLADNAIIVLDPINRGVIDCSLGMRTFVGGNCTVNIILMVLGGLFEINLVNGITIVTYQSASGAGVRNMQELLSKMRVLSNTKASTAKLDNFAIIDCNVTSVMHDDDVPLAGNIFPCIDNILFNGQSKEEWKGSREIKKLLVGVDGIEVDGICVRINSLRSHSQCFIINLRYKVSLYELEECIACHNPWINIVTNSSNVLIDKNTPAAISGTIGLLIGRLRKFDIGEKNLTAFAVGDQLLWGAVEPLKRILNILGHLV